MSEINLADFLSQLSGKTGVSNESLEEKRSQRFKTEDARMMLRNAMAVLDQVHQLEHGQIVRYKQGLESGHKTPCGHVGIFLRYIDSCPFTQEPASRGLPMAVNDEDCVVGVLLPSGAMAEYMTCSRYLEPDPEE